MTLSIALHNLPEGVAISLPPRESGISRITAFKLATLSGLTEPLGALLTAPLLGWFPALVPAALGFVGGVMIFLTLDELIPVTRIYGQEHSASGGLIVGFIAGFNY